MWHDLEGHKFVIPILFRAFLSKQFLLLLSTLMLLIFLPSIIPLSVNLRLLSSLLPETQEVLETVLSNRQKWQKAQEDGDYVYRPVATSDKEIQLTVNGSVPDTCQ